MIGVNTARGALEDWILQNSNQFKMCDAFIEISSKKDEISFKLVRADA